MATLKIHPPLLYAAGVIWPPMCSAVVAVRFVCRRRYGISLGLEDWLLLPATVFLIGLGIALIAGTALGGLGYPTPPVPPQDAATATSSVFVVSHKVYYAYIIIQTICIALLKLSCILFYRRIFSTGSNRLVDGFLFFMIGTVILWGVGCTLGWAFICGAHFSRLWYSSASVASCGPGTVTYNNVLATADVIQDGILFIFPQPLIWQLQMSLSRKLALSGVFVMGGLALAASITRMVLLRQAVSVEFAGRIDVSYLSTSAIYFMINEAGFALCSICLPVLLPAAKHLSLPSTFHAITGLVRFPSRSGTVPYTETEANLPEKPEIRATTTIYLRDDQSN